MRPLYRYRAVVGGLALRVPASAIARLRDLPGVRAVHRDGLAVPDTERSPRFIGAPRLWRDLGGSDRAGEGIVVGILDTGIWPEHPSFADPDPRGHAYPAPPPTWNGGAGPACGAPGPGDPCAPLTCSNKLIGAFAFLDAYKASVGLLPGECNSARDTDGHGTHTSSTAAGNAAVANDIEPRREVSGIAPRAHVAMYRVCAEQGCFFTDSVAAIDQAVLDGVDVINFSIGGGGSPYGDIVALAFRDAYAAGIFVAASAGNAGPNPNTVAHREPWVTTVAASTHDREFQSSVTLRAAGGRALRTRGASITMGHRDLGTRAAVLAGTFGDTFCLSPFAPATFNGEIVICQRGINGRAAKSFNVAAGGAGGMLLYNPTLQGIATDNHFLPTVHLEADDGAALLAFMAQHDDVTASFRNARARRTRGDVVAAFSARGGTNQTLGISKPDVTAPGVQVLAGNSPLKHVTDGSLGAPGQLFQAIQGTSMSSPHVAGAAALLRQQHPDWSPGQIKSALMTTARTRRVYDTDGETDAGPFDVGSGRIDLKRAGNPGLTFDVPVQDFIDHAADLWNTNYPSVFLPASAGLITASVERHARNVASRVQRYRVRVQTPDGSRLAVQTIPERTLGVAPGDEATLQIDVDLSAMGSGELGTAAIELRGGGRTVRIPVVAVRP
jgi:subtilisin family serine protease